VNTNVVYRGEFEKYGLAMDPMLGDRIGGGLAHSECNGTEDKIAAELAKAHAINVKDLADDTKTTR